MTAHCVRLSKWWPFYFRGDDRKGTESSLVIQASREGTGNNKYVNNTKDANQMQSGKYSLVNTFGNRQHPCGRQRQDDRRAVV